MVPSIIIIDKIELNIHTINIDEKSHPQVSHGLQKSSSFQSQILINFSTKSSKMYSL